MTKNYLRKRFLFLDIIKGIGIIQFILWHIFVNYYALKPESNYFFRSVFFVTGLFVFSSGFLVTIHYRNRANSMKALIVRSIRLLSLVFLVNFLGNYFHNGDAIFSIYYVTSSIISMFYLERWDISLQILVVIALTLPISYSMSLVLSRKLKQYRFMLLLLLVCVAVFDLFNTYIIPYLWRYLYQGVLGSLFGIFFYENFIMDPSKLNKKNVYLISLISLSLFFLIEGYAISTKQRYIFSLVRLFPELMAIGGVFVGLSIINYYKYDILKKQITKFLAAITLIGRNSLFVYLLQITIIDCVVYLFPAFKLMSTLYIISCSIWVVLICIFVSFILEKLMTFSIVRGTYRFVLG